MIKTNKVIRNRRYKAEIYPIRQTTKELINQSINQMTFKKMWEGDKSDTTNHNRINQLIDQMTFKKMWEGQSFHCYVCHGKKSNLRVDSKLSP